MYYYIMNSPLGSIIIFLSSDKKIIKIEFSHPESGDAGRRIPNSLKSISDQFSEYFSGLRKKFNLSFTAKGTPFDQRVWRQTLTIPYGQTRTYKEIALKIGKPNSSRAVGGALKRNPIPIIIPCHRVVASNGIGGYTPGLDYKIKLLELERDFSALGVSE